MSFTCSSRDDSLRVKVSEEEAVDQRGFSKSRFTFGQEKKIQESMKKEVQEETMIKIRRLTYLYPIQILVSGRIQSQSLHV